MQDLEVVYGILNKIYVDKSYLSIELNKGIVDAQNRDYVTKIVYGVLEKNVQFDYFINKLVAKKAKNSVILLLKIGMYLISYMDSIPDYAAVNSVVDLCYTIKKHQLKGFVNAVLKEYIAKKDEFPKDEKQAISVKSSTPLWLSNLYIKEYGIEKAKEILFSKPFTYEHIRVNANRLKKASFIQMLKDNHVRYIDSISNALFVENSKYIREIFNLGLITIQSKTSMICAESLGVEDNDEVLDLCAAPGGKSVYLAELKKVNITSCDIHDHRLTLIKNYIDRMGVSNINVVKNDATKLNENFVNKFDKVLCDVPCSGLGIVSKKPDIYLGLEYNSIQEMTKIQKSILNVAKEYVKVDGTLLYSTCTILKEENTRMVAEFLKDNDNYILIEETQFFPDSKGLDGFYIAKLKRVK